MSKTTKSTPSIPTLADLKMAVINFHKGDDNEYLRQSIARDSCYTSHNSLNWKLEQMSKVKEEIAVLMPDEGNEVTDVSLMRKVEIYHSMQDELVSLQLRHDADLECFKQITGEIWYPRPKKKADTNATFKAAKAILG